jgi:hypothetical protein
MVARGVSGGARLIDYGLAYHLSRVRRNQYIQSRWCARPPRFPPPFALRPPPSALSLGKTLRPLPRQDVCGVKSAVRVMRRGAGTVRPRFCSGCPRPARSTSGPPASSSSSSSRACPRFSLRPVPCCCRVRFARPAGSGPPRPARSRRGRGPCRGEDSFEQMAAIADAVGLPPARMCAACEPRTLERLDEIAALVAAQWATADRLQPQSRPSPPPPPSAGITAQADAERGARGAQPRGRECRDAPRAASPRAPRPPLGRVRAGAPPPPAPARDPPLRAARAESGAGAGGGRSGGTWCTLCSASSPATPPTASPPPRRARPSSPLPPPPRPSAPPRAERERPRAPRAGACAPPPGSRRRGRRGLPRASRPAPSAGRRRAQVPALLRAAAAAAAAAAVGRTRGALRLWLRGRARAREPAARGGTRARARAGSRAARPVPCPRRPPLAR